MGLRKVYGIDTGTSTVKIYSQAKNAIYIEKNMIAVRKDRKVMAVGDEAYEMFEKAPANIQVDSPMAFGMIADIPRMEYVLYHALKKIDPHIRYGSKMYFAVPMDLSQLEKGAYDTIVNSGRMHRSKVYFIEKPIADALALNISPEKTKGSMIVNIGSQSTEISVLAQGRVIITKMLPIGGRQMNLAICDEIRRTFKLQIGSRTAKRLKLVMGNLDMDMEEARKIYGIDSLSGLPREDVIRANVVNRALRKPLREICGEIKSFLERTPPQISYEILKEGLYLAGGGSRIEGIDRYMADHVGYGVNLSRLYEQCTIAGVRKIINDKYLQKWALPMKQRKL